MDERSPNYRARPWLRVIAMILKGSQRGGSKQLAAHLLKMHDNEHVEVHELRGFLSDDLHAALHEIYAVSRGTRAKQFLFSLSLNPPGHEHVPIEAFEAAIEDAEKSLGLEGQPRAVVFHEKNGRRHAHVVWSRIDTEQMKAINMPHFKLKLREVSRDLYLVNGWQMPRGLVNSRERDPRNFNRAEWEQAKRAKQDPKALKALFQECWASSDSSKAFAQSLQARGYTLAHGDRRGHVAVDFRGEVYAISKWAGVRTKDVRGKLGEAVELPSIEQAKAMIASRMTDMLRNHVAKAEIAHQKQTAMLAFQKSQIVERQRQERSVLETSQQKRWSKETNERASRLNKGVRGLWDRLTGQHEKQARENDCEALLALRRDRQEKDNLIERHLDERHSYHQIAREARDTHAKDMEQLHCDIADYMRVGVDKKPLNVLEQFHEVNKQPSISPQRPSKDRGPTRGH